MRERSIDNNKQGEAAVATWDCNMQEVFCEEGALRNFAKFTERQLCQSLSLKILKERL